MPHQHTADVKLRCQSDRLTGRHVVLIGLLMACGFIVVGQLYVTIPMAARIASGFGIDLSHASLVGTAFGIAYAAGFLLFGSLSDRYGRKRMVLIGLVATALATILVGLAGSFGFLLASRSLQGLAASIFPPAALAIVAEELPLHHRPLGVSLMSLAFLCATPLSQLFVAWADSSLSTMMFALAPLYLLGAVGLHLAAANNDRVSDLAGGTPGHRVTSLFRDPGIVAVWAASLTVLFSFVIFYSGMQVFGANIGVDLQAVRLIGLPPLLLTLVAAPLMHRYSAPVITRCGLALAALAMGVGVIASPTAIIVASGLLSAGVAFTVPGLIATVAGRATSANRGLALAIYSFTLFLGASVAAPVAQALSGFGIVALSLVPLALLLAAIVGLTIGIRRPSV